MVLGLLSFFEHVRSVRTSSLLNVYLFFTVFFDGARSRTFSLNPYHDMISVLFTTRVGVKLFLAIFEARGKDSLLVPGVSQSPPEWTSGVYSRMFFWWQNDLFRRGFSNSLSVDDLFDLDKHLRSDYLQQRIQPAWEKCRSPVPWSSRAGANSTVLESDRQRAQFALHDDSRTAEMVCPGCHAPASMSDSFQLLSAVPD